MWTQRDPWIGGRPPVIPPAPVPAQAAARPVPFGRTHPQAAAAGAAADTALLPPALERLGLDAARAVQIHTAAWPGAQPVVGPPGELRPSELARYVCLPYAHYMGG
jgi:hypothetical protein